MPPEIALQLDQHRRNRALTREWLLTNGLGGYAMGTALGVNSRRYHGLFVPALSPPVGRIVALHSVVMQLVIDGDPLDLSTCCFGDEQLLHPSGWRLLRRFAVRPPGEARWEWSLHATTITATLRLVRGRNEASFTVRVRGLARPAMLRVRPLAPLRGHHAIDQAAGGPHDDAPVSAAIVGSHMLRLRRDGADVQLAASAGQWSPAPEWWKRFSYFEDRARGQAFLEDVFSPGLFELSCELDARNEIELAVSIPAHAAAPRLDSNDLPNVRVTERIESPMNAESPDAAIIDRLRLAADQFIVRRRIDPSEQGAADSSATAAAFAPSVIAGYPWFTDWGRDAMISLPGLMLAAGRHDEARAMLLAYANGLRDGLIPNVFGDGSASDEPSYNAVDASLWFVLAVRAYVEAMEAKGRPSDDDPSIAVLRDAVRSVLHHHVRGIPRLGVSVDPGDGLLIAISPDGAPLTWMDARRGGATFTPRDGKAVEINALWINALHAGAALLDSSDAAEAKRLRDRASQATDSFRTAFWSAERGRLHDVLQPDRNDPNRWTPDSRLRPNQLFALSLPVCPLDHEQQRAVLMACREHLLTPFGLRTLGPLEPGYLGRFEGDLMQRDTAYHNGTVWPWLFGPYVDALLRVEGAEPATREEVRRLLRPLLAELDRGCLGQLPEVFDGDAPHRPGGCSAQAWSVAEILRILTRING